MAESAWTAEPLGQPKRILRTLPEQIADDLGGQIVGGLLSAGDRLREIEIAESYGVSRAPVREAIRILTRRGLAEFAPRRGARVMSFDLQDVVDTFNIMGVVIGLAARYFAAIATDTSRAQLADMVDRLDAMAEDPHCEASEFGAASWRTALFLSRHCGSELVERLLAQYFYESPWSALWQPAMPDFQEQDRRRQAASLNRRRFDAICEGDGDIADALSRDMARAARDRVIDTLAQRRGETPDPRRLSILGREL